MRTSGNVAGWRIVEDWLFADALFDGSPKTGRRMADRCQERKRGNEPARPRDRGHPARSGNPDWESADWAAPSFGRRR